jgi:hypothetical protein
MKIKSIFLISTLLILFLPGFLFANSAPVVSNVTAAQRGDDSKLVDIYYNLADADGDTCTVWAVISDNGGSTWTVPAFTFSGHIGQNVTPGTGKHIIWDAGRDMPGKVGNYKARVYADDGQGPSDMVLVAAGYFPYQNATPQIYLPVFLIDKYEVTNARYCEFLNNADPSSAHYDTNMEIDRTGSAGNYSYTVKPGKENFPIRYVSYYDADAFAQWRSQTYGGNYRLPTEQEWEKAAAWDPVQQHYYIYGFHQDTISCPWCNYNSCYGGPLSVGSFNGTGGKNNAYSYYGCYDMSGNVWEWTSSIYSGDNRVIRGGDWGNDATGCRCTYRHNVAPSFRNGSIGFRLVLNMN